jgi:hypothetical protein
MKAPRLPSNHDDRLLDCQEQIEDAFIELVDRARAVGWNHREVVMAIGQLSQYYLDAIAANEDTERQIAEAMARQSTKH